MSYPKQLSVLGRLEGKQLKALDAKESTLKSSIRTLWARTKSQLKNDIRTEYRNHFRSGNWDLPSARRFGTMYRIERRVRSVMESFKNLSTIQSGKALRDIYRESQLRHAYMLDQVTPPGLKVRIPRPRALWESVRIYAGADASRLWRERWNSWMDAYQGNLIHNLNLGALNESTIDDAADEVDATKAGSPAYDIGNVLERLFSSEAILAIAEGALDISAANGDLVEEEIWQTREDESVCEICDPNDGMTIDEADDDIPAHPNCRCFWRIVPASYAELLRSGDSEDQALADYMDANGLVPNSMIVNDEDGNVAGKLIVTFNEWLEGSPYAVTAQ